MAVKSGSDAVSWLVAAAVVAGVTVSAGVVDVSAMLRPAAPAPVAAAPAAANAPSFVTVVKAAEQPAPA
ncbi:hypothetical protein AB0F81_39870, partial [Actinoplanes sp. NPDC024001]|uniref:hypothetical protein n=1 Tax=Actinoplanes sp. NPDC024001 TaxID=3154598 RepID=UPI0033C17730